MTPEQKEAFRREVLEEAAKLADDHTSRPFDYSYSCLSMGRGISAGIRALAASQPAPAATISDETLHHGPFPHLVIPAGDGQTSVHDQPAPAADVSASNPGSVCRGECAEQGEAATVSASPAPAADTGQAVDRAPSGLFYYGDLAIDPAADAPLDAERVREAAQALMDTVDTIYRDGRYVQPSIITATAGLRAALRQKEGK